MAQNVDDAIETLQLCLRVLDMASRVDGLIESKRYYAALRVSAGGKCGALRASLTALW